MLWKISDYLKKIFERTKRFKSSWFTINNDTNWVSTALNIHCFNKQTFVLSYVCFVLRVSCPTFVLSYVWYVSRLFCPTFVLSHVCPCPTFVLVPKHNKNVRNRLFRVYNGILLYSKIVSCRENRVGKVIKDIKQRVCAMITKHFF